MTEEINTKYGFKLLVEKREVDDQIEIIFRIKRKINCLLHWGLSNSKDAPWQIPPKSVWPEGSIYYGKAALKTPFLSQNGDSQIIIRLDKNINFSFIHFVFFSPDENRWDNNQGKNYHIRLPGVENYKVPAQVLREELKEKEVFYENTFDLGENGELAVAVIKEDSLYEVTFLTDISDPLILHWGLARISKNEWLLPSDLILPERTEIVNNTAAQTPFVLRHPFNQLKLYFKEDEAPIGIPFLLKQIKAERWLKNRGKNFYIPVIDSSNNEMFVKDPQLTGLTEDIIEAETGHHSWTLMHRFNLCHDLLEGMKHNLEGLALLFVWLRFSAIRQLDWQRNYNTQPRELSHSQDRLTLKLAEIYTDSDKENRKFIRQILTTSGRGGEGQRIRDDILNIMHRHKIKEVSGHFMEEWHQKLHNNATPDDIVICEAYLEFLRSDGNLAIFYKTLNAGGVTKERLESFERPIVTDPDFVPHLKEGLIHDFENYLKLLRSIHSGTDLESAINAADYLFDNEMRGLKDFILQHRDDSKMPIDNLVNRITELRFRLNKYLKKNSETGRVRDLLFLDLSLEEFLRVLIERNIHTHLSGEHMVELVGKVVENLLLANDDQELTECLHDWIRLKDMPQFSIDWALHAKSIVDRLMRKIGSFIDHYYQILQPKAEFLGNAFQADSWTITLFSEEVVRGQPAFVLSMLLRHIDPVLRKTANLGNWQVISPGQGAGHVEVVDTLRSIQGKRFDSPTIIIADKVIGDEEPPEGVTAVITPDVTDIVSHVAVRARNSHLLFATCYDAEIVNHLKSCKGHLLNLSVEASGNVVYEERDRVIKEAQIVKRKVHDLKIDRPDFTSYVISSKDFNDKLVGGKSNNLMGLKGKLPDWIHQPASVALPFGAFEEVLTDESNKEVSDHYRDLVKGLDNKPKDTLMMLCETILSLNAPNALLSSLRSIMTDEGIALPEKWENAWRCIKQVWASKWNERAFYSRQVRGIPHENLFMAVLIQEVIETDYAFVIHTVNPFTNDKDELYAEVVMGLGETLVGNYPGRAFSFTSQKRTEETKILAYPSKSTGLFGSGLIFRSDSNGEDLVDYAGAGLYDSFMLEPPREVLLDYSNELLVWNEDFKKRMMSAITSIGAIVEKAMGSPQDIEGVYKNGEYYIVQTRPQVGTSNK